MNISLSAVVPIARRNDANAIMEQLGFGPNNFSVELAPGGIPAVTFYGFHAADDGTIRDYLNGTTNIPKIIGLTKSQVSAIIASVKLFEMDATISSWGKENFDTHANANGIERMRGMDS